MVMPMRPTDSATVHSALLTTLSRQEHLRNPPAASSAEARAIMQGNKRRDTGPELALRSELHRRGLRYRVDFAVRVDGMRPIRPDVVFTRWRVLVFVDGCFWHGCPQHRKRPRANAGYWDAK